MAKKMHEEKHHEHKEKHHEHKEKHHKDHAHPKSGHTALKAKIGKK